MVILGMVGLDPEQKFAAKPGEVVSVPAFSHCVDCAHIQALHGTYGCSACKCKRWVL